MLQNLDGTYCIYSTFFFSLQIDTELFILDRRNKKKLRHHRVELEYKDIRGDCVKLQTTGVENEM